MFVKPIKLSKNRGNGGHITSYTINIGSAEARECGFTDDDVELEKVVDFDKKEIIIRIKNNFACCFFCNKNVAQPWEFFAAGLLRFSLNFYKAQLIIFY